MTPLKSAKKIVRQDGGCVDIGCGECFLNGRTYTEIDDPCYADNALRLAKQFIKENDDE